MDLTNLTDAELANVGNMLVQNRKVCQHLITKAQNTIDNETRDMNRNEQDIAEVTAELNRRGYHDIGHARSVVAGTHPKPKTPQ